jgi:hypothetical protein
MFNLMFRGKKRSGAPRFKRDRLRGDCRRLLIETLEHRNLLSVSIVNNSGNGFSALSFNQSSGGYVPPDTCGAAGPSAYVETVNQTLGIYNPKATGASLVSDSFTHFWFTTGGLTKVDSGSFSSDPIVVYDELIGRFIVGDQDVDSSTLVSKFDLAVSKSNNPATLGTSDWAFYQITTTESGLDADYPGNFGYNADAFVFTLNMFSGNSIAHAQVISVSAADLQNAVASPQIFHNDLSAANVRPTTMHDSVAGDPMWLVTEHGDNASIDVYKMTNVRSNSAIFSVTNLAVTSYSQAVAPKNPNSSTITSNIDSAILKAAEANSTIVAAHTVAVSSRQDVVQWYAISVSGGTPTLSQQGRVSAGTKTYLTYPSIDINSGGAIGMTYIRQGNDTSTDYMSMFVTGRIPSDSSGTMETSVLVPNGTGQANYTDFANPHREGDLSGINVDPVDGSFWAANEFANTQATANWGTAVANFVVGTAPNITTNPTNQTVTAGGTATFTAAAGGNPAPTVLWQVSTNGGATFTPISGATSTTYSFTSSAGQNSYQYRAVFSNSAGSATTTAATLTVQFAPGVTTNPTNQTVTTGNSATFTAAASGNPTPTVQWQVSTDGGTTFNPINGATSTTYSFTTSAGQNGNQYEAVFTNVIGTATTTAASLTVGTSPSVTTNPSNDIVSAGGTATFTAAASGSPTPTVQWQVSVNGGATFTPISGATSTTYSFTASASQNNNQYEAIFTNAAGSATTTAATLNVQFVPNVTTNPTNQTVSAGSTATFTAAANGNPAPTVQWQESTDGGATFAPISGATSTTYSFTAGAGQNGNQYEAVFTNAIGSATTTAAALTVQTGPAVTTNPSDQTVTAGNMATFTAAASGNPTPTVQWQVSTDGGATFNAISGATSTTYSFTASAGQNGNHYEAVFTNALGTATTTSAALAVQTLPNVTTNPTNQTVTAGNTATFTAAASGNPTPTVQWQVSTDGGATFMPINGATSATYSFTASAGQSGNEYEAVFINSLGSATTMTATLTVQSVPNVTTNPTNQSVTAGSMATYTAAAGGSPTPTVQWEVSTDGGATFTPINGATSTTYSFTASAEENNNQYRAVFTNGAGSANTTAATLTVQFVPNVTTNPTNQTVTAGNTTAFTAAASGNPTPTVQWQVSTDGGATFMPINGATSTTYSFTASAGQNGNQFEAVFTNSVGSATTTAATLTVQTAPSVATNPTNQSVGAGVVATFTATAGGNPAPTVQWQVSADGGATFTPINGATSTTYSFAATAGQNGNRYEAVFTNSVGTATTTAATLTVVPTFGTWNSAVDGPWNAAANWTDTQGAGVPGFSGLTGDQAAFSGAAGLNVDLGNFSPSLASLSFGPAAPNYVIQSTGSGVLQMNNGGGTATIGISAGSQTIASPVQLISNTTVLPAASSKLTVSNSVTGNTGVSLTVGDASNTGTLAASPTATVTLSGATNVPAGTLQVDGAWSTTGLNVTAAGGAKGSGVLAGGGSITVNSGGLTYNSTAASTFAGSVTGSSSSRLEVDGGRLTLSGPSTTGFAGGIAVAGGKLIVDHASDLPDAANLSIGAGTSAFDSPVAAAVVAAPAFAIAPSTAAATASITPPAAPQPTVAVRAASVDASPRQSSVAPTIVIHRFAPAVDWFTAQSSPPSWAGPTQRNDARVLAVDLVLASRAN